MALLQLTQLTVGQPTSAPAVELGHLAVGTPDEGGQISAVGACLPDHPIRHGPPPTADWRGLVALLRQRMTVGL